MKNAELMIYRAGIEFTLHYNTINQEAMTVLDVPPQSPYVYAMVHEHPHMANDQKIAQKVEETSIQKEEFKLKKVVKTDQEWKAILTDEQYRVLRKKGTELAFSCSMHQNKEAGNYYCAGCGTLLFNSDKKFDSGSGWPSYYQPVNEKVIEYKPDNSHFMKRTEVLCAVCDGHLGHVFNDGPAPTYQRYCINSAALVFKKK